MKITTWNVNSIRARLTHVVDFLREHSPDILCLQETKVVDDQFPRDALEDEGYNLEVFGQKSYNGVAILSKQPMEAVVKGMPGDPAEGERRVLGAAVGDWLVLNLYVPNGQDLHTEKYRYKLEWLARLRAFLDANYTTNEKLVVLGDFNITFDDRDVPDPDWWRDKIHCSQPERDGLNHLLQFGLRDLLRLHHEEAGIYTWWHYAAGALQKNNGLRIDHLLASEPAAQRCREVIVHKDARMAKSASDHAPVSAVFDAK